MYIFGFLIVLGFFANLFGDDETTPTSSTPTSSTALTNKLVSGSTSSSRTTTTTTSVVPPPELTTTPEPEPPAQPAQFMPAQAPVTPEYTPPPAPDPDPVLPAQDSTYYSNCREVWQQHGGPIQAGDPGYGSHLDRDGDGIGCEKRPR